MKEELPQDRGWSWVICFAGFTVMFIAGTIGQAMAVLFLEIVQLFGTSITLTSLNVMLYVLAMSFSALVSTGVLVPRYGERPIVVVCGLVYSLCSIGLSQAPNIVVFHAVTAVKGIVIGMVGVPTIGLVSHYFNKRRSLALTISNVGLCVSSIVAPPTIRLIISEYGIRGTYLIQSAFEMHLVVVGLLLRPVSFYSSPAMSETKSTADDAGETKQIHDSLHIKNHNSNRDSKNSDAALSQGLLTLSTSDNNACFEKNRTPSVTSKEHEMSFLSVSLERQLSEDDGNSQSCYEMRHPTDWDVGAYNQANNHISDSQELQVRQELLSKAKQDGQNGLSVDEHNTRCEYINGLSVNSRRSKRSAHYASALSITEDLQAVAVGLGAEDESEVEGAEPTRSCFCIWIFKQIFDPSLVRLWTFWLFLVITALCASYQYLLQYLPTIGQVQGATKDQAASLLTILGAVDLVSRLAAGYFADMKLLKATQIVGINHIGLGITCLFNPLFTTYQSMIVMAVLMGLFIGPRQALMPMMLIEIVGAQKMTRGFSLVAMFGTFSGAVHSPLLSAVMEATGSYTEVLYYTGVAMSVTGSCLFLIPLVARLDARLERKRKAQDTS